MSLTFRCKCPECTYRYAIAAELAGRRLLCPECGSRFRARRPRGNGGSPQQPVPKATGLSLADVPTLLVAMIWGSNYVEQSLVPGEEIVHRSEPHWIVLLPGLWHVVCGVATIMLSLAFSIFTFGLSLVGVIAGAAWIWAGLVRLTKDWFYKSRTETVVTTQRLVLKTAEFRFLGGLSVHTSELSLGQLENVSVDIEGFFAHLLGFGDLTFAGTGGTKEVFACIKEPLEFRKAVQRQSQLHVAVG